MRVLKTVLHDGFNVYEAGSADEALLLASEFKRAGRYDLFRGHASSKWDVLSTLARTPAASYEAARPRLEHLTHAILMTRLASVTEWSPDHFIAVGQHYGIPSHMIDFTSSPEVALFFATERPGPSIHAALVCVDSANLQSFFETAGDLFQPAPEWLHLTVPDLWRLQAQQGCFLHCQVANLEDIYPFDRIVFPCTPPRSPVPIEHIYPTLKSALELAVDRFLVEERQIQGQRWWVDFLRPLKTSIDIEVYGRSPSDLVLS